MQRISHDVYTVGSGRVHYHIVDADPEGEKTVGGVPLCARGLRCENVMEQPNLVHDGSRIPCGEVEAGCGGGGVRGVQFRVHISSRPRRFGEANDVQHGGEIRGNKGSVDSRTARGEVKDLIMTNGHLTLVSGIEGLGSRHTLVSVTLYVSPENTKHSVRQSTSA